MNNPTSSTFVLEFSRGLEMAQFFQYHQGNGISDKIERYELLSKMVKRGAVTFPREMTNFRALDRIKLHPMSGRRLSQYQRQRIQVISLALRR